MKAQAFGRQAIKATNSIINVILLTVILMLLAFAGYALWDSQQIFLSAEKAQYAIYKPQVEDEGKSFMELQAINPEVFAWLTVYGTNIDYPVAQGPDNQKYVSTNVEGQYSMAGAIFLDYHNSQNFSDFNSILYGHHMEKRVMFGEIGYFSDQNMFDTHQYGNLYFEGQDYGLEFFAFLHADAYDSTVFYANVKNDDQQAYLSNLLEKAIYLRDIGITLNDRIILLSTCSASSTNGRDILIGRIGDELFEDPFITTQTTGGKNKDSRNGLVKEIVLWPLLLLLALATRIPTLIPAIYHRKRISNTKRNRKGQR